MNIFLRLTFCALMGAFLAGCAMVKKDTDYMSSSEYQHRPTLKQGLVGTGAGEQLSEVAIQKLLSGKISLPKTINLAVVRLSPSNDGFDFQTIEENMADQFYQKSNWGTRVQSLIPVPEMMLIRPVTISGLRQTAALLQADALVVIKPMSYSDWKFQWTDANKAKGVTTLEVLLLDTRTSAVPFTSLITESVEIDKSQADYSNFEHMARAKKASEEKAMLKVSAEIQKFLSKVL